MVPFRLHLVRRQITNKKKKDRATANTSADYKLGQLRAGFSQNSGAPVLEEHK